MPFGLSNTPSAFQHFMNNVFSNLLDVCIVVYLDNLLIYSPDSDTHVSHVHEVLRCLCKHSLFAKAEKCEFHSTSVEYLGYVLSPGGLTMAQDKIKTILDWPELCKVKDIQADMLIKAFHRLNPDTVATAPPPARRKPRGRASRRRTLKGG